MCNFVCIFTGRHVERGSIFLFFSGRSLHSKIIFGLLITHNSAYCFNKSCNKLWHSAKIREVNGQFANFAKVTKAFFEILHSMLCKFPNNISLNTQFGVNFFGARTSHGMYSNFLVNLRSYWRNAYLYWQAVLQLHPYHIDTLLQLSEVCRMSEDPQMAAELIGNIQCYYLNKLMRKSLNLLLCHSSLGRPW